MKTRFRKAKKIERFYAQAMKRDELKKLKGGEWVFINGEWVWVNNND